MIMKLLTHDKYTVYPSKSFFGQAAIFRYLYMIDGSLIQELIVGPYCYWPKVK